ncbi:MAG: hypothetical protein Kow0090_03920 [Myxococcota bacterium]
MGKRMKLEGNFVTVLALITVSVFFGCAVEESGEDSDDDNLITVASETGASFELKVITRPQAPSGVCPNTAEGAANLLPKKLTELTVQVIDAKENKDIVKETFKNVAKGGMVEVKGIKPGIPVIVKISAKAEGGAELSGQTSICYNSEGVADQNNGIPACIFVANEKRFVKIPLSYKGDSSCLADVMDVGRMFHTATPLPDGKILIAGGFTKYDPSTKQFSATNAVELYDPATGSFTRLGDMDRPRAMHTATLLPGGYVIIAGGTENAVWVNSSTALIRATSPVDSYILFISSTLDFNRNQNGTVFARRMHIGRTLHTATCVPLTQNFTECINGETGEEAPDWVLLLAGGDGEAVDSQQNKIYASKTFELFVISKEGDQLKPRILPMDTSKDIMNPPRVAHTAFVVAPNNAVFFGGTPSGTAKAIQRYTTPQSINEAVAGNHGTISDLNVDLASIPESYLKVRYPQTVRLRAEVHILAGGVIYDNGTPKFDANPLPLFFSTAPSPILQEAMTNPQTGARIFHCAAMGSQGIAFISGGTSDQLMSIISGAIEGFRVDISDPSSIKGEMATLNITMRTPRMGHTCLTLDDGTVLILGGMSGADGKIERSGEIINY